MCATIAMRISNSAAQLDTCPYMVLRAFGTKIAEN
jgi:hypothetical protein